MFRWLKKEKQKAYQETAWEKYLPPEDLSKVYDDQGWTGATGMWRQRNLNRLAAKIAQLSKNQSSPVKLLDVACFNGDYLGRLMQMPEMEKTLQYTGVDVTPSYISTARKRWEQYSNANFQVGSAFNLPFAARTFDIVFNSGMLIHVDDPISAIREFARVSAKLLFVETTVTKSLQQDFIDENKSGPKFIDRIYRYDFIRQAIASVATIDEITEVPYQKHISVLFESHISA